MEEKKVYALNTKHISVGVNLISCYNTLTVKPKKNVHADVEPTLYCAIITVNGCGKIYSKDDTFTLLRPYTLFLGQYKDVSYMLNEDVWHHCTFWFEVHGIDVPHGVLTDESLQNGESFCNEIIGLLHENTVSSISLANSMMASQLLQWIRLYQRQSPDRTAAGQGLIEMTKYINANIQNNIKLNDIATHFNYCEKHFRNLFKRHMGISPKTYIDIARIEQAQSLLLTSSTNVTTIAKMLGFSSPSHFMTTFKKYCRLTPTQYRDLNRK